MWAALHAGGCFMMSARGRLKVRETICRRAGGGCGQGLLACSRNWANTSQRHAERSGAECNERQRMKCSGAQPKGLTAAYEMLRLRSIPLPAFAGAAFHFAQHDGIGCGAVMVWYGRGGYGSKASNKSFHSGLMALMSASFFARVQPLSCFSRAMASSIRSKVS